MEIKQPSPIVPGTVVEVTTPDLTYSGHLGVVEKRITDRSCIVSFSVPGAPRVQRLMLVSTVTALGDLM